MGALFGGGGSSKAPKPAKPVRMPDTEDPSVTAAEDLARRQAMARSGRGSTVYTSRGGDGSTMAYRNTVLGQS